MFDPPILVGHSHRQPSSEPAEGAFVFLEGEPFYRIAHYDRMRPFFLSIVSDSDHWLFLSSNGGLTAGRKNPDHALFPYTTDDKIHDANEHTGGKTLVLVDVDGTTSLWEPFASSRYNPYALQRNLYKNVFGNKILFEETNLDLGLTFFYAWGTSERFGFVRRSGLRNSGSGSVSVRVLDGLQNLLPYGVERSMQTNFSTLLDAYKKNELQPDTGLGLFRLSSIPVDRPEPSEALRATTVWSAGLDNPTILLSTRQLESFCTGGVPVQETDVRAERVAYFVCAETGLEPGEEQNWVLVAEIEQGPAEVVALSEMLKDRDRLRRELEEDVARGTERLRRIVAGADGLQQTEEETTVARHFANVLYNLMRGGALEDGYAIDVKDLAEFVQHRNEGVARSHETFFSGLPERPSAAVVLQAAAESGDRQLERLCYGYLPLSFSRRHGDPSRPWNFFSIETRKEDGGRNLHYQGNWRDIFQNWETLALSFPGFAESMVATFVNASTPDGYNPYRITRDGIEWEVADPHDPWSFIGYWGDHQIIYLLKLLELSRHHHPDRLQELLHRPVFAYANVPYRIAPYEVLLKTPHETITYDHDEDARIAERVKKSGADGKLVWRSDGAPYLVNLAEKLLVPALAKLTNFIPGAGIWMNTQRPEWNDANNALVGYGVSMVTLCYLRRFQRFAAEVFASFDEPTIALSVEVADLLEAVSHTLAEHEPLLGGAISDRDRKRVLDDLGQAGSAYRTGLYERGFSGVTRPVECTALLAFFERSLAWIDHTIRANRREDGLYHAYNLMSVDGDAVSIRFLYPMLEGQVAALSSGLLSAEESLAVLSALRGSALYREDQHSYILYPDRRLPRFVEKNVIPADDVARSVLLRRLLADGNRKLVVQDVRGDVHFSGSFRNAKDVAAALDRLAGSGYEEEVEQDRERVLETFETMFDHRSYTGRSGTFFAYEGLGSIYWHMVSKLLLAVAEVHEAAVRAGEPEDVLRRLSEFYYDIRAGLGTDKTPAEYGAFPTDPYSHTPAHTGARQPGMTGQVKEDILARWGELGVVVEDGCLHFRPDLLRREEFLTRPASFEFIDPDGLADAISLEAGMLAFTYCQVPIVYRLSADSKIAITYRDGRVEEVRGWSLDRGQSTALFERSGEIRRIEVALRVGV